MVGPLSIRSFFLLASIVVMLQSSLVALGDQECGLDCVFMALKRLRGDEISLVRLRSMAGPPTEKGYSLAQLRDLAAKLGLYPRILKGEPMSVESIATPCVAIMLLKSGHYVAMNDYDLESSLMSVFDPTEERFTTITFSEWSGYCLLLGAEEIVIREPSKKSSTGTWIAAMTVSMIVILLGGLLWKLARSS